MIEKGIVDYCAPTLAGLKTGGLFGFKFDSYKALDKDINRVNQLLNPKGVVVKVLKADNFRALVYVYRPILLKESFQNGRIVCLLEKLGYDLNDLNESINLLKKRILEESNFPHEVGVFLGYPVDDVVGFIKNCGESCKLCGIWKVYGDTDYAKLLFEKYKKCECVYKKHFSKHMDIQKLTIQH